MAHIDLSIFEPLLQIVIDSLVRDLADQRKVGDSHFFLLCTFKYRLPDLGLAGPRITSSIVGGFLPSAGALRNGLDDSIY